MSLPQTESIKSVLSFAAVEEKVQKMSSEHIDLIRQRLTERQASDLTFRRRHYRSYRKHFLVFYFLSGIGCMLKYYTVLTLKKHHMALNQIVERGSALPLQALEDKAAIIHRKRNIDPYLPHLGLKYPGIREDLNIDTHSKYWVPFDIRYPIAMGMRYDICSPHHERRKLTSAAANIISI